MQVKRKKRWLALSLAVSLTLSACFVPVAPEAEAEEDDYPAVIYEKAPKKNYTGDLVIIHSNDVHGAIDGYAKMASLRKTYEKMGAQVILVDAGDFSQGDVNVNESAGRTAITMMNKCGYSYVVPGNHDFDFGYKKMRKNLGAGHFNVVCANVLKNGKSIYKPRVIFNADNGARVGFFGLDTPETATKSKTKNTSGISFYKHKKLYACAQKQVDALEDRGADVIIALTHLGVNDETATDGNRSIDVYEHTKGIDLMIDGHSHTVMTSTKKKEPIQSTGTRFANVGVVVVEPDGDIADRYLVSTDKLKEDPKVEKQAKKIENRVDSLYGQVFAYSELALPGVDRQARVGETALGDLVADSYLWYASGLEGELKTDKEHIVSIANGGSVRADLPKGNISQNDILNILPFLNSLSIVYVKGYELLEALEASTFSTPDSLGGYPQTAGIRFSIDTTKPYDKGAIYPGTTYHRPASIQRVSIESINGQPFDLNATYAVATNDFVATGGDTYYVFTGKDSFDTGALVNDVTVDYITQQLSGVISEAKYGSNRGDQTIIR